MHTNTAIQYISKVLENMPSDWLRLTTHRLDIYVEKLAKAQFTEEFQRLFLEDNAQQASLANLPTAYDYIRLGHPLSCVLEWGLAQLQGVKAEQLICFSSQSIALQAILRQNALDGKKTQVLYKELPACFDAEALQNVYGYNFELVQVNSLEGLTKFEGSRVYIAEQQQMQALETVDGIDFVIHFYEALGSMLLINGEENMGYISTIQHVRRRETIAMTPINCITALNSLINASTVPAATMEEDNSNLEQVRSLLQEITGVTTKPLVASSGLSIQYAIMMGLIDDALEKHPGKDIKIIVPTNCYGGTNDQARRVAACLDQVEVVDLHVDAGSDMVKSINTVLGQLAQADAVPYIIAEIPTNPRVEVPHLEGLQQALAKVRYTPQGTKAVDPVFILDQTFCPNVHFIGEGKRLSTIRSLVYASGSKFPSAGNCTAGYCVVNDLAIDLGAKIEKHLILCDNAATSQQLAILAEQLPSMNERIAQAYKNTRAFVSFIEEALPEAKINFVSEELAQEGFTPSVFSMDLPTKGENAEEREAYKRKMNLRLIDMMIGEIPTESKYCVSYGQPKGCYWTIPATSTQGTTKEGDKDYIVRISVSPKLDFEKHKVVFLDFLKEL